MDTKKITVDFVSFSIVRFIPVSIDTSKILLFLTYKYTILHISNFLPDAHNSISSSRFVDFLLQRSQRAPYHYWHRADQLKICLAIGNPYGAIYRHISFISTDPKKRFANKLHVCGHNLYINPK